VKVEGEGGTDAGDPGVGDVLIEIVEVIMETWPPFEQEHDSPVERACEAGETQRCKEIFGAGESYFEGKKGPSSLQLICVLPELLGVSNRADEGIGCDMSDVGELVGIIPADFVKVEENAGGEKCSENFGFEENEIESGAVEEIKVCLLSELDTLSRRVRGSRAGGGSDGGEGRGGASVRGAVGLKV
jgi:hypothetical protein